MTDMLTEQLGYILVWGLVATAAMSTIMEGSHYFGFSRMSLPFLIGALFTGNRRWAELVGFICYLLGGWIFAAFYVALFHCLHAAGWWRGALIGFLHGLFLLISVLPLAYTVHPRMASPYDGPEARRRIEPPGFMALNYGRRTPIFTLLGQTVYGIILGATFPGAFL